MLVSRAKSSKKPTMHDFESIPETLNESAAIEDLSATALELGEEDAPFGETEEMQLASELLEITDENELDGFIGTLITRAAGGARRVASSPEFRRLLRQAAKSALPMIGGAAGNLIAPGASAATGSKLAAAASNLFGLELEGLSPEDQEFEVARRFVRFAGAGARNAARFRGRVPPKLAARRALGAAARRHAPGFLRRPRARRWPRRGRFGALEPDYGYAAPLPIEVTCHCCGAPQPEPARGASVAGDDANSLPDTEPANTEPQTQTLKETQMHDLDHTTMEISDEADGFEFGEEPEYTGEGESPFNQEQEEQLAAELLEINDEQELDQFLGSLFKKVRGFVGSALRSPLLRPLGGFLKGAIKKALPIAGGALGSMFVPGIGGQIGSRLASGAGSLLGLEFEGLAPEDQEFEVAKRLVRMAGTAMQNAAQSTGADPQSAAKSAVISAAQAHLPGLLQQQHGMTGRHRHRPRSGRWYRRNRMIVLVGV
jgi:hypothetical protein